MGVPSMRRLRPILLLIGALCVVATGYALISRLSPDSDKAAWTQAVGSVIGLFIAILVPAWQHEKAEELRRQEARETNWRSLRLAWLLSSRATLLSESIGTTRSKVDGTETSKMRARQFVNMKEIYEGLESIPLIAIPTLEAIQYFMKVKRLVNEALQEIERSPYPEANMGCNELYGRPWIRLYGELKEASAMLDWHAKQHRDGNTKLPEPTFLNT